MRIGVVTTSYPRSDGEHAGSFVAAHVAALRTAGHHVDVIGAHTIASDLFYRGGAPDELERGGVRTYLAAARFSAQLTRAVARRADEWDLVIAHWLAPSALAAVLGTISDAASRPRVGACGPDISSLGVRASLRARFGPIASSRVSALLATLGLAPPMLASCSARRALPILAIAHGGDVHTLRRLGLLAPTLYALRARDVRLAFVSAELREVARAAAPRLASWLATAIIQPMGIDVARFAALRARVSSVPSAGARKSVLVVGRLVPVKGVDVAIHAAKLTATQAHLVIAGDGPERARLEALASAAPSASTHASPHRRAASSATAGILFLGAVDTTTRDRLLAEAACVIVPSRVLPNGRTEGTPMIALEALAAGVPVIASAVGGLRELPGITRVRPDDPRALATAIDRVLSSRAETKLASRAATIDDNNLASQQPTGIRRARDQGQPAPARREASRPASSDYTLASRAASIDATLASVATLIDGRRLTAPADLAILDWTHVSARLLGHAIGPAVGPAEIPDAPAISGDHAAPGAPICEAGDTSGRHPA